ncbi:MAG: twin-arginine translocase TatA/TatE family subunit [Nitrosopumilaceae archaeon]
MLDYWLNIMGSEWIIIIFVVLIVLLGTNRLPEVTKKLGRVVGEYSKAKNDMQKQFKDFSNSNLNVLGPVQNEREKLDTIAKTIGIDATNRSDEELRELISGKIGKQNQETRSENNSKSLN